MAGLKLLFTTVLILLPLLARAADVTVVGSALVNQVAAEAAVLVRAENDFKIRISTEGGSDAGLAALGNREADIAMISRPVTPEDRAAAVSVKFTGIPIGYQVLTVGVAADVWAGGVRAITAEQARSIYETRITNWKELGGADQAITFFNWEEGLGVWELFASWMYGDNRRAPKGSFQLVSTHPEARNSVEFKVGAMAAISPLRVDGRTIFSLALKGGDGHVIELTAPNILSGKYPLARPLVLVVNDKPTGNAKIFVDFLLSPRGQDICAKRGFYSNAALLELK